MPLNWRNTKNQKAWLQSRFPDGSFPTVKGLQEKAQNLKERKDKLQANYEYYRDYGKDLMTVSANVDAILDVPSTEKRRGRKQEIS